MAKKKIPDVNTDDIVMSARDFPSASRRSDPAPTPTPPEPAAALPPGASSPPPGAPSRLAAPPAPDRRIFALGSGATVVACIAAVVSVVAAIYGLSRIEDSAPATSPPAEVAPAPAEIAPAPAAVAPEPAGATNQILSLTMLDLSRALVTARPYENEIRAVRAFGEGDADVMALVDVLGPYAATGVGTLADIRAAMPMLAEEIRRAIETNERSWTKRTATSLRSILTFWRPADAPVEGAARAALARAESQLAEGGIEGAIAALSELEGPARQAAAPLLEEMERRLAVDRTAGALTELALNRLAGRD